MKHDVIILVHPGSACGSADFSLGRDLAGDGRAEIMADLAACEGGLVVIDGSLSVELAEGRYASFGKAIEDALARTKAAGAPSRRIFGCDDVPPHQDEAVRAIVTSGLLDRDRHRLRMTGAWYDPSGESGCVNGVMEAFEEAGFEVEALDSAVTHPEDCEADFGDEDAPGL